MKKILLILLCFCAVGLGVATVDSNDPPVHSGVYDSNDDINWSANMIAITDLKPETCNTIVVHFGSKGYEIDLTKTGELNQQETRDFALFLTTVYTACQQRSWSVYPDCFYKNLVDNLVSPKIIVNQEKEK